MKVAKIFYGLREKAAGKHRWLGKVRAAWCSGADRLHKKDWRIFAHTGHKPGVVCWARAAEKDLTQAEIEGIGGHEFGHLVGEKTGAPAHRRYSNASGGTPQAVQDEADAIAAELFGKSIRYNRRKLQEFGSSKKNPSEFEVDLGLWEKGYRYKLIPHSGALPLYAKTMQEVAALMREYKNDKFDVIDLAAGTKKNPRGWFHTKQKGSRAMCLYSHPGKETLAGRLKKKPAKRRAIRPAMPTPPRVVPPGYPESRGLEIRPAIRKPAVRPPSPVARLAPRPPSPVARLAPTPSMPRQKVVAPRTGASPRTQAAFESAMAAVQGATELAKKHDGIPLQGDPEREALSAQYKRARKILDAALNTERRWAAGMVNKVNQAAHSLSLLIRDLKHAHPETIPAEEKAAARRSALAARKTEIARGVPPGKATKIPTWAKEAKERHGADEHKRKVGYWQSLAFQLGFSDPTGFAELLEKAEHDKYLDHADQRKLLDAADRIEKHIQHGPPIMKGLAQDTRSAIYSALVGQVKSLPPKKKRTRPPGFLPAVSTLAKMAEKAAAAKPIDKDFEKVAAPAVAAGPVDKAFKAVVTREEGSWTKEQAKGLTGPQAGRAPDPSDKSSALDRETYQLIGFHYVSGRGWEPAIGWKLYMQGKAAQIPAADQARLRELAVKYQAIASGPERGREYYPAKGMLRTIDQVLKRQEKAAAVSNPPWKRRTKPLTRPSMAKKLAAKRVADRRPRCEWCGSWLNIQRECHHPDCWGAGR